MSKSWLSVLAAAILVLSTAALVSGQNPPQPNPPQPKPVQPKTTTTTVTKTVQNPDGTYTIIEYPVGKEVTVTLNPISITGATGVATVLRDPTGTTIKLNLKGLPSDLTALNLYAVDPTGAAVLLGPIAINNGVGDFTTTTPLNKFMIVASSEADLARYSPETKILFRSAVPEG